MTKTTHEPNILIWYWGRKGGGLKYSEEIAKTFIQLNTKSTFLSFSKQADLFDDVNRLSIQSHHINTYKNFTTLILRSFLLPFIIFNFMKFLKKNNITIVYTTMSHTWTIFFIPFFKLFHIKHYLTVHDATIHPGDNPIWNHIHKYLYKHASKIITLSEYVSNELITNYHIPHNKIIKSIHGLLNYKDIIHNEKKFAESPFRIVFFGRIVKYKGLINLLLAQEILENKYTNIILEIYGSGDISSYKNQLSHLKNLKLENRWIHDNEIYTIFQESCINVSPYIEASQSGVIPLALGCGIPSIVTSFGGLKEQIINNETGYVISNKDIVNNLVRTIETLYLDRELCQKMSKNAYHYAHTKLNWTSIGQELKNSILSE